MLILFDESLTQRSTINLDAGEVFSLIDAVVSDADATTLINIDAIQHLRNVRPWKHPNGDMIYIILGKPLNSRRCLHEHFLSRDTCSRSREKKLGGVVKAKLVCHTLLRAIISAVSVRGGVGKGDENVPRKIL